MCTRIQPTDLIWTLLEGMMQAGLKTNVPVADALVYWFKLALTKLNSLVKGLGRVENGK